MNANTGMGAGQVIGTTNGLQVVGLDIAKQVFQMHTVDMGTGEIVNVQIKRAKVLEHFVRPAGLKMHKKGPFQALMPAPRCQ